MEGTTSDEYWFNNGKFNIIYMLSLFKILQSKSKSLFFFLAIIGIVNAVTHTAILYIVNMTISFQALPVLQEYNWLLFFGILLISFMTTSVFQRHLIRLANDLAYEFNIKIFEQIRTSSVHKLVNTGKEKVYAVMDDIDDISAFPVQFISILNSLIIVVCGLGYMFYSSWDATLFLLATMTFLAIAYAYRNTRIEKLMNKVRDLENEFFEYMNDLLAGFKELVMSSKRNDNLHEKHISRNRKESRDLRIKTSILYLSNDLAGTYSWYIVMGAILFGFSRVSDLGVAGAVVFTFVLLYIMGPLTGLIRFIPVLTRSKIAYERVMGFLEQLSSLEEEAPKQLASFDGFHSLRVEDLCFQYPNDNDSFALGPLNLTINKGEIVFIKGGNGSGKSTFMQILVGLFNPSSGNVYYNEELVQVNTKEYRDNITAIFAEPFLFSRNYEDYKLRDVSGLIEDYSTMFRVNNVLKVDYENDRIDKDLSKGQQKRLALILSLLEKRPILVMDEWAAEQDPEFRRYFYEKVLSDLKNIGKTIVLITHDDRYFGYADRVIKFEQGKIVNETTTALEYDKEL